VSSSWARFRPVACGVLPEGARMKAQMIGMIRKLPCKPGRAGESPNGSEEDE
jgi:hypothetical protein